MFTIGRALAGNPDLVLVDEATEGLSPVMVDAVIEILCQVNREGRSILLVEHAVDVALMIAKRAYVMSKGKTVFAGTSEELQAAEDVRKKYMEV